MTRRPAVPDSFADLPLAAEPAPGTAGGEAGQGLPDLRPDDVDLERGDLLVLATDGVRATFAEFLGLAGSPQDIARRIVERSWTETDDAVALVARYLGPTW